METHQEFNTVTDTAPITAPEHLPVDTVLSYVTNDRTPLGKVAMLELSDDGERIIVHFPNPFPSSHDPYEGAFTDSHPVPLQNTYTAKDPNELPSKLLYMDGRFRRSPVSLVNIYDRIVPYAADHIYLKIGNEARLIKEDDHILVAYDPSQNKFVAQEINREDFEKGFNYSGEFHAKYDVLKPFIDDLLKALDGAEDEILNRSLEAKGQQIKTMIASIKRGEEPLYFMEKYKKLFLEDMPETLNKIAEYTDKIRALAQEQENNKSPSDNPWLSMRSKLVALTAIEVYKKYALSSSEQMKILDSRLNEANNANLPLEKLLLPPKLEPLPQDAPIAEKIAWAEKMYCEEYDPTYTDIDTHKQEFNSDFISCVSDAYQEAVIAMVSTGDLDLDQCRIDAKKLFIEQNGTNIPVRFIEYAFESNDCNNYRPVHSLQYFIRREDKFNEIFGDLTQDQTNLIIRRWAQVYFSAPNNHNNKEDYLQNEQYAELLNHYCHDHEKARQGLATFLNIPYTPYQRPTRQEHEDQLRDVIKHGTQHVISALTARP
jgi:hypothetical protein